MSLWPQHDADGYYIGKSDDYGSGTQPNNTASMDDWPEIIPGFIPRKKADGPGWDQVEDHKGKEGYVDGTPQTIREYGPLPQGWSTTPPEPSPEDQAAQRRARIMARLAEIDAASVRPLRALVRGEAVQADTDKLATLDAEAEELRAELAALEVA